MTTYGQVVELDNGTLRVSGCDSIEEARLKVLSLAVSQGYRRPGWWRKLLGAPDYFERFGLSDKDLLK